MKRATKSHRGDNVTDGISIHALVKRATTYIDKYSKIKKISIHALVKRATYYFKILYTA